MSDEKTLLVGHLDRHRRHVLGIIEGLDDDQLRRAVLPSGWSVLGMLRHLALSDEHYWFRCVMGGSPRTSSRPSRGATGGWPSTSRPRPCWRSTPRRWPRPTR